MLSVHAYNSCLANDSICMPLPLHSEQPKGFKDFWFVFRSRDGGEKLFEYYATEKKFQERAMPKGVIHLGTASSVKAHSQEKRQQFCIEMTDDAVFFFEAGSVYNAQEWISCLNAVLFGRGPNGGQFASCNHLAHCSMTWLTVKYGCTNKAICSVTESTNIVFFLRNLIPFHSCLSFN